MSKNRRARALNGKFPSAVGIGISRSTYTSTSTISYWFWLHNSDGVPDVSTLNSIVCTLLFSHASVTGMLTGSDGPRNA